MENVILESLEHKADQAKSEKSLNWQMNIMEEVEKYMGMKKRKFCISFVVILALAIIVICISYGKQKIQYSTPAGMNAMDTVIYYIDALNERNLKKANSVCADHLQGTSIEKCIYDVYSIETESEDSDSCVIIVKMNKIYRKIFGDSEEIDSDITFWLEKDDDGMWLIVNEGTA